MHARCRVTDAHAHAYGDACMRAVTAWDRERHILKRELKQGQYSVFAYYLARNAVLLPFEAAQCLLFTAIMYFMVGFQADAAKFFTFFIVLSMFQVRLGQ